MCSHHRFSTSSHIIWHHETAQKSRGRLAWQVAHQNNISNKTDHIGGLNMQLKTKTLIQLPRAHTTTSWHHPTSSDIIKQLRTIREGLHHKQHIKNISNKRDHKGALKMQLKTKTLIQLPVAHTTTFWHHPTSSDIIKQLRKIGRCLHDKLHT